MKILNGRGFLFVIADDVKMTTPHEVETEVVGQLPKLAMFEGGLMTQATKSIICVYPSVNASWTNFLENNLRGNNLQMFSIHGIPSGKLTPPDEHEQTFYIPH